MMTTRNSPLRINELSRITRTLFRQHHHGVGLFVLIATLFVLSFLAGLQPPMQFRVFMAGEVADSDVVAHRSLTVEDTEAAKIKRNQVAMLQPTVFDLSVTEIAALRQKIFGMLKLINGQETSPEAQDALRASLAEKLATPVSSDLLAQWMSPEVQEYVLSTGLPWFEDRLREGVVGDVRLALPSKNGIIVRDVDTKAETLRPDVSDIRDVPAVLAAFTQKLRSAEKLTPQGRRAVLVLFSPLIMPTLTLNREATQALGNAVAQTVEPVYYHIQKGEVVVYQGERVTREKQLKLQSLYQKQEGLIHSRTVAGTFVFSLILTLGLFMAPSGKPGTPLRKKDFLFISLLLFVFGIAAKGTYMLVGKVVQPQDIAHDLAEYRRRHCSTVIRTVAGVVHHHYQRKFWVTGGRHPCGIGHVFVDIFPVRANFLGGTGFYRHPIVAHRRFGAPAARQSNALHHMFDFMHNLLRHHSGAHDRRIDTRDR